MTTGAQVMLEREQRRCEIEVKIANATKWLLDRELKRPVDERDEYDLRRTWRSEVPYACLVISKELYAEGCVPDTFVKHFWRLYVEACRVERFPEHWRKARDPSPDEWEHMKRLFHEDRAPYNTRQRFSAGQRGELTAR